MLAQTLPHRSRWAFASPPCSPPTVASQASVMSPSKARRAKAPLAARGRSASGATVRSPVASGRSTIASPPAEGETHTTLQDPHSLYIYEVRMYRLRLPHSTYRDAHLAGPPLHLHNDHHCPGQSLLEQLCTHTRTLQLKLLGSRPCQTFQHETCLAHACHQCTIGTTQLQTVQLCVFFDQSGAP